MYDLPTILVNDVFHYLCGDTDVDAPIRSVKYDDMYGYYCQKSRQCAIDVKNLTIDFDIRENFHIDMFHSKRLVMYAGMPSSVNSSRSTVYRASDNFFPDGTMECNINSGRFIGFNRSRYATFTEGLKKKYDLMMTPYEILTVLRTIDEEGIYVKLLSCDQSIFKTDDGFQRLIMKLKSISGNRYRSRP